MHARLGIDGQRQAVAEEVFGVGLFVEEVDVAGKAGVVGQQMAEPDLAGQVAVSAALNKAG